MTFQNNTWSAVAFTAFMVFLGAFIAFMVFLGACMTTTLKELKSRKTRKTPPGASLRQNCRNGHPWIYMHPYREQQKNGDRFLYVFGNSYRIPIESLLNSENERCTENERMRRTRKKCCFVRPSEATDETNLRDDS